MSHFQMTEKLASQNFRINLKDFLFNIEDGTHDFIHASICSIMSYIMDSSITKEFDKPLCS